MTYQGFLNNNTLYLWNENEQRKIKVTDTDPATIIFNFFINNIRITKLYIV